MHGMTCPLLYWLFQLVQLFKTYREREKESEQVREKEKG